MKYFIIYNILLYNELIEKYETLLRHKCIYAKTVTFHIIISSADDAKSRLGSVFFRISDGSEEAVDPPPPPALETTIAKVKRVPLSALNNNNGSNLFFAPSSYDSVWPLHCIYASCFHVPNLRLWYFHAVNHISQQIKEFAYVVFVEAVRTMGARGLRIDSSSKNLA